MKGYWSCLDRTVGLHEYKICQLSPSIFSEPPTEGKKDSCSQRTWEQESIFLATVGHVMKQPITFSAIQLKHGEMRI